MPLVGTFHCYSRNPLSNGFAANVAGARRLYNKLHVRIAVSEAARWTCERFYGGRYRIVPNGVDLAAARPAHAGRAPRARDPLRGPRGGAKGPARTAARVRGAARSRRRGATDRGRRHRRGGRAAAARPRGGARGRPRQRRGEVAPARRVRSALRTVAGRRELRHGAHGGVRVRHAGRGLGHRRLSRRRAPRIDGLLVPPADPAALGEALCELALDSRPPRGMAAAARERAERFSWPRVADEVLDAYEDAVEMPEPATRPQAAPARLGLAAADGEPVVRPRRMPSIEPNAPPAGRRTRRPRGPPRRRARRRRRRHRAGRAGRRAHRHRVDRPRRGGGSSPVWILVAFALMCASMLLRAESWHAILRAALPGTRVRRRDTARGTMIGVLHVGDAARAPWASPRAR